MDTLLSKQTYHQISNVSQTFVGNKIYDHSNVVGASPVGAALITPSFSTWYMASKAIFILLPLLLEN